MLELVESWNYSIEMHEIAKLAYLCYGKSSRIFQKNWCLFSYFNMHSVFVHNERNVFLFAKCCVVLELQPNNLTWLTYTVYYIFVATSCVIGLYS